jgi:tetratricopeptide (TPR) repeat protein
VIRTTSILGGWICGALVVYGQGASGPQTAAVARAAAEPGVLVRLVKENEAQREVLLVRRQGDVIFFRLTNSPPGVYSQFKAADWDEAEFKIQIPEPAAYLEASRRQWASAARRLHVAIAPALPFLDLPRNNVFEPAVRAAWYYVRAAQQAARRGEAGQADARTYYTAAYEVFREAGRAASWHPYGQCAAIRAMLCLVELGRLDEAEAGLAKFPEPEIGDMAWGVYWLARAQLYYAREQPRYALEAAILSYLHENKDVETFPDALMLAAQCYEDVNEVHRARDVYYEVARLFPGTDWGDEARARLVNIMDRRMTERPEDPNIAGIFFGTEENMNEKVRQFLKETEPKPNSSTTGDKQL